MLKVVPRVFLANRGLAQPAVAHKQGEPLSPGLFQDIRENLHGAGRSLDKILIRTGRPGVSTEELRQFLVNRHVSTPLTCAKHISRSLVNSCAMAIATYESGGSEMLSPMARLSQPCSLELVDFPPAREEIALAVNQAFWRSASVLTAAVASRALSSQTVPSSDKVAEAFFSVSVPRPLSIDEVKELDKLSHDVIASDAVFDHLVVPESIAQHYGFEGSVNLCKLDDYVCIVDGPTIASPRQIAQFKLLAAFPRDGATHLVGTALPVGQKTSSFNWDLICQNAVKKFAQ